MVDTTQLQATLDKIPAHTWYANPTGGLTFVNTRCADYLGLPSDHPLRLGIDTGAAWDSHIALLHPDDHAEARRVSRLPPRPSRRAGSRSLWGTSKIREVSSAPHVASIPSSPCLRRSRAVQQRKHARASTSFARRRPRGWGSRISSIRRWPAPTERQAFRISTASSRSRKRYGSRACRSQS